MKKTLKDSFVNFYSTCKNKDNEKIWDISLNFKDSNCLVILFSFIDSERQKALDESLDNFITVNESIYLDLQDIKSKIANIDEKNVLHFIQFWLSIFPIKIGAALGILSFCHDWIIYALSDEMPYGNYTEYKQERLEKFFNLSNSFVSSVFLQTINEWLCWFYYYSRASGALTEIGNDLLFFSSRIVNSYIREQKFDDIVDLICYKVNWGYQNKISQVNHLVDILISINKYDSVSLITKKKIGLLFSTQVGFLTKKKPSTWAQDTLSRYPHLLIEHEKLQLLVTSLDNNLTKILQQRNKIIQAIQEYANIKKEFEFVSYKNARVFHIILPLLKLLVENGQNDYVLEVLVTWKNIPHDKIRKSPLLCCLPAHPEGVLYSVEEKVFQSTSNMEFTEVLSLTNKFFSSNIILNTDPDFTVEVRERPGVPVYLYGKEFEKVLQDYYGLIEYIDELKSIKDNKGLVLIPGEHHPVQSLFVSSIEKSWPLVVSFQEPKTDRSIKKVIIWPADSFYNIYEANSIYKIFANCGIDVELLSESDLTKENFLRVYASNTYDVIWFISHGNYNPYTPHLSSINVNHEQTICIQELSEIELQYDQYRRLFFLNVCDGGTPAIYGGLYELGIAPVIASSQQALVSHLWPVDPVCASVFGIFLAIGLTNRGSYFEAFKFAISSLNKRKQVIIDNLEQALGENDEFIQRLINKEIDFTNIAYWGSPVFYE